MKVIYTAQLDQTESRPKKKKRNQTSGCGASSCTGMATRNRVVQYNFWHASRAKSKVRRKRLKTTQMLGVNRVDSYKWLLHDFRKG